MTGFFRAEAVRHRQRGAVGRVRLVRPLPLSVLTVVVVATAVALAGWLSFGSYTRKARLAGVVVATGAGEWQVELFATSTSIASLREAQYVRLSFPALGSQAPSGAGGMLVAVSRTPVRAVELPGLPAAMAARAASEPLYRARAQLAGGAPAALRQGVAVDAEVHIERRRLIGWMFPQGVAGSR